MDADAAIEPVDYMSRSKDRYDALGYPAYRWALDDSPSPFAPLGKPLDQVRIGLISSGGVYRVGQKAFHFRDDISFRRIPVDEPTTELRATHFAYDTSDARRDPNVVLPIRALQRAVGQRRLGSLADEAFTFVGGIYSARRCREILAPRLLNEVTQQQCDAVLLVPV
jgi:D-proline reductase (dithiol) PrdB